MTPPEDETRGPSGEVCSGCGSPVAASQRYCLRCGARCGDLPPAIAARIAALLRRDRGGQAEPVAAEDDGPGGEGVADDEAPVNHYMPTPRAAAVAVLGMLALGVLLGSATSQIARSADASSLVLQLPSSPAPAPEPEEEVEAVEPEAESSAVPVPVAEEALPAAPLPEEPLPAAEPEPTLPPELPEEEALPEVKHVFLVVLGENGFEEAFGPTSTAPYLASTLAGKGELLANYYAVAQSQLANEIALISGQGPTPETALNCPTYTDVAPGTVSLEGQVEGNGCVYPAETETLPGQLAAAELDWRAYVEDSGNGVAAGQPATCRHPALGAPDPSQLPAPGDAYVTWRNPFVYFHSIVDSPECAEDVVGTDQLAADLATAKGTPALSYIVPDACHSGGEVPCEPGQPTGALAAEAFLREVVPPILASPAYKEGGLIAITSAQAPQSGEHADPSACCAVPTYPNLPPPAEPAEPATGPVKPSGGGGRVGMLLLSPFVEPGSVDETGYYNHFTLLLTIEELFGLEKLGFAAEPALSAFDSTVFQRGGGGTERGGAGTGQSRRISRAVSSPRATPLTVSVRSGHGVGSRNRPSASAFPRVVRSAVP